MKRKARISIELWGSNVTIGFDLDPDLDLHFQGQIWNLLYLSQKWSDCHKTKSKHINWTLGLKCDHRIWPWPWPWPWIFKVKYRICYISAKSGLIATKRKANVSIELQASKVTNGFDLDHNLDLWILKVKRDLDLWPHTWPWPWIFMDSNFEKALSQNGRADWHCSKGVAVGHSWPWPWPFGDQGQVYGSTR